jgi:hypothetical protein
VTRTSDDSTYHASPNTGARSTRSGSFGARAWRVGPCLLLVATHLLLPIERGVPLLRVGAIPVTVCLAASVLVFGLMFVESYGRILTLFWRRHVAAQLVFVATLVLSSLFSQNTRAAMSVPVAYFGAFVLDYVTVVYLFETGSKTTFLRTLRTVLLVAAAIGVADGIFDFRLGFYEQFADLFRTEMGYGELVGARASGPLGNPIIFGTAMMLGIPFAMDLTGFRRVLLLAVLLLAAFATISRTALIMTIPFAVAFVLLGLRRRSAKVITLLGLLALVTAVGLTGRANLEGVGIQWSERLLRDFDAEQNVAIRLEALKAVMTRSSSDTLVTALVGHGPRSGADLARTIASRFDTIDNAYATLYFEAGIVGLVAYLWIYASLLARYKAAAKASFHWHGIVAFLTAGVAFVSIYYVTFALLVVTSTAILTSAPTTETASARPAARRLRGTAFLSGRSSVRWVHL